MKTTIVHLFAAIASIIPVFAENPPHAHEKEVAGPNGGRVITDVTPHAEFFVTADRKVRITFLSADDKTAVSPATQTVTVTAGERSAPVKMTFVKSGDALVSEQGLPAGNDFPTVVQIKVTPEAKTVVEKFNLNLSVCPTCKLAEYACNCEH